MERCGEPKGGSTCEEDNNGDNESVKGVGIFEGHAKRPSGDANRLLGDARDVNGRRPWCGAQCAGGSDAEALSSAMEGAHGSDTEALSSAMGGPQCAGGSDDEALSSAKRLGSEARCQATQKRLGLVTPQLGLP
ncbi:unnamed protein product [Ilex paraguariensis]|uniref:Uncharacterized protein n=1 Tax=Ilex paraguariensis TaxID=185542 RepID=A0ABC8TPV0_9AQUA